MPSLPIFSNQNHFAPGQPLDPFSMHRFDPTKARKHRQSMVIDLFGLYLLNNIQLSPNSLKGLPFGNQARDRSL
jgi:hypothetical protein